MHIFSHLKLQFIFFIYELNSIYSNRFKNTFRFTNRVTCLGHFHIFSTKSEKLKFLTINTFKNIQQNLSV